jgi:thymidylate synthase (FAD)
MNLLDKGYVTLERFCGTDIDIVNSARVSFNKHVTSLSKADKGLINFLMRERHGTPFEMVDFTFKVKCPIAVMREWIRHRIASYNEMSGRYTKLESEFYIPTPVNVRHQVGKPGAYRYEPVPWDLATRVIQILDDTYRYCDDKYKLLLSWGIAKEQARLVLPVGIYTKFYFKTNLRALFNFFSLRSDETAMWEIRQYSLAMEELVKEAVPVAMEAFEKHGRRSP